MPALFSSAPPVVVEREDDVGYIDDDDDDDGIMDEDEIACIAGMLVGHPPALRRSGGGGMGDATIPTPIPSADQILGNRSSTSGGDDHVQRRQLDDDELLGRANEVRQQLDDGLGRAFARKLLELEVYRRENGDCLVPKRYRHNPSLGNWVNKQRQNYRKFMRGERTSMNEVRLLRVARGGCLSSACWTRSMVRYLTHYL